MQHWLNAMMDQSNMKLDEMLQKYYCEKCLQMGADSFCMDSAMICSHPPSRQNFKTQQLTHKNQQLSSPTMAAVAASLV